ncbi:AAA family ATPase [Yunchengibacter salinarum]|uniref:AAA family ATPase n=1 Tax=Yunchengibacter salinarum TaxID=3133399 RepID=UPI0035B61F90
MLDPFTTPTDLTDYYGPLMDPTVRSGLLDIPEVVFCAHLSPMDLKEQEPRLRDGLRAAGALMGTTPLGRHLVQLAEKSVEPAEAYYGAALRLAPMAVWSLEASLLALAFFEGVPEARLMLASLLSTWRGRIAGELFDRDVGRVEHDPDEVARLWLTGPVPSPAPDQLYRLRELTPPRDDDRSMDAMIPEVEQDYTPRLRVPNRAQEMDGPTLTVAPALGVARSTPGRGQEIRRRRAGFERLGQPMPLTPMPDPQAVLETLGAAFPYAVEAIRAIHEALALGAAFGASTLRMPPLLLVGPPGTGKTHFARKLADFTGAKSLYRSIGGNSDNRMMEGTAAGYSGANPCLPVHAINELKVANPLMILDEVDKARPSHNGNIFASLMAFLEKESAARHMDECLMTQCDLSAVSWVLLANTTETLPAPLLSRCRVVQWQPPRLEHMPQVIRSLDRALAEEYGADPRFLEPLPESTIQHVQQIYAQTGDLRMVQEALRTARALEASMDLATLH